MIGAKWRCSVLIIRRGLGLSRHRGGVHRRRCVRCAEGAVEGHVSGGLRSVVKGHVSCGPRSGANRAHDADTSCDGRDAYSLRHCLPRGCLSASFYTRTIPSSTSPRTAWMTGSRVSVDEPRCWRRLVASFSDGASSSAPCGSCDMDERSSRGTRWRRSAPAKLALGGSLLAAGVVVAGLAAGGLDPKQIDGFSMGDAARYARSVSRQAGDAALEVSDHIAVAVAVATRRVSDSLSDAADGLIAMAVLAQSLRAVLGVEVAQKQEEELEIVGGREVDPAKRGPAARRKTSWFAPRVSALLADLASCSRRRHAIATTGDGAVVDWLLRCLVGECWRSKLEASRAVASLVADDSVRGLVLSRNFAIPILLRYVSSSPPVVGSMLMEKSAVNKAEGGKGEESRSGRGVQRTEVNATGRCPLLSVILDLLTCDHTLPACSHPTEFPAKASMEDISAVVSILREGLMEEAGGVRDAGVSTGGRGVYGIGIGVLGDTAIIGVQKTMCPTSNSGEQAGRFKVAMCKGLLGVGDRGHDGVELEKGGVQFFLSRSWIGDLVSWGKGRDDDDERGSGGGYWTGLVSSVGLAVRGKRKNGGLQGGSGIGEGSSDRSIVDPLAIVGRELAVPFAAWALAGWASASSANCSKIATADVEGEVLKLAILAKERSVRWHGIRAAQHMVTEGGAWSEKVGEKLTKALTTVACGLDGPQPASGYDSPTICLALEALTSCVNHSKAAKRWMFENGLPRLRDMVKATEDDKEIQRRASMLVASSGAAEADGQSLSLDECKKWTPVLLKWACGKESERETRGSAVSILDSAMKSLAEGGVTIQQAWLASMLTTMVVDFPAIADVSPSVGLEVTGKNDKKSAPASEGSLQNQIVKRASAAAAKLAKVVVQDSAAAAAAAAAETVAVQALSWTVSTAAQSVWRSGEEWLGAGSSGRESSTAAIKKLEPVPPMEAAAAVSKALKAMADLSAADANRQRYIVDAGGAYLLRSMILGSEYEACAQSAASGMPDLQPGMDRMSCETRHGMVAEPEKLSPESHVDGGISVLAKATTAVSSALERNKVKKHALRVLAMISTHIDAGGTIGQDATFCKWLAACADGRGECQDLKMRSYCRAILAHIVAAGQRRSREGNRNVVSPERTNDSRELIKCRVWPRFEDGVYLMAASQEPAINMSGLPKGPQEQPNEYLEKGTVGGAGSEIKPRAMGKQGKEGKRAAVEDLSRRGDVGRCATNTREAAGKNQGTASVSDVSEEGRRESDTVSMQEANAPQALPLMDVVFIHGLCGGPFKTWRVAEKKKDISQGKPASGETVHSDSGCEGACWPSSWLAEDINGVQMFTVKYKTNLSEWSGATLPLKDVSSHLLERLVAAGVGERPLVFVTHSMGGLVAKQMIASALEDPRYAGIAHGLRGVVFYSCPHFGSRLADMPWRMGYVLRPAPSTRELRSGSPRLEELNKKLRPMHTQGQVSILSFCESTVTPLVEGYAGLTLRMEVVPVESAYPGFGDVVVLEGTDHVHACKPQSRTDTAYVKTLDFLKNVQKTLEKEKQRQQALSGK